MTDIEIEIDKLNKKNELLFTMLVSSIEAQKELIKMASLAVPMLDDSKEIVEYDKRMKVFYKRYKDL